MAYRKGQSGGVSPATRITQEIIARLESGTKPWIKPWRGVPVSRPLRACGVPYRGMNVFWLWMVADMCGYALARPPLCRRLSRKRSPGAPRHRSQIPSDHGCRSPWSAGHFPQARGAGYRLMRRASRQRYRRWRSPSEERDRLLSWARRLVLARTYQEISHD